MRTIIQLSDFHIRTNDRVDQDQTFLGMIEAIRSTIQLKDKPIWVYCGDIVYYPDIYKEVDKALAAAPSADRELVVYDCMENAFKNAENYFERLVHEFNIDRDRFIICCGNHDVYSQFDTICNIDCPSSKRKAFAKYGNTRFSLFSTFCQKFSDISVPEVNYFTEIDGLNFLVVNSNWINKRDDKGNRRELCINCKSLSELIESNKSSLDSKKKTGKLQNILVAHAPFSDYCEDARYIYPDSGVTAIIPVINYYFGLKLFGDKHTDDINYSEYIVGAPLFSTKITLGIHQFDNTNAHHHKTIQYANNKWETFGSESDIDKLLPISEPYIKERAKAYLFGSGEIKDFSRKIQLFSEVRSSNNWTHLDNLLCSSAEIKTPIQGKPDEVIDTEKTGGFINTLCGLIADSSRFVSITLKGEARLGKSVCLSMLYMDMLNKYSAGILQYMPLYFDAEKALSNLDTATKSFNRDTKKISNNFASCFSNFLKDGIKLAKQAGCTICCIIDGLSQHYLYDKNRIEDTIKKLLDDHNTNNTIEHVVYCIDTNDFDAIGLAPQEETQDSEHIVQFNKVLTTSAASFQKCQEFINAFSMLQSCTPDEAKVVRNNVLRLSITSIDTNFLLNLWEQLKNAQCKNYYELISEFVNLKISNIESVAAACYEYTVHKKPYSSLFAKGEKSLNKEFDFIRTQGLVINYLLAINYVNNMDNYNQKSKDCLDRIYGHDVCYFIREHIEHKGKQRKLLAFIDNNAKDLSIVGLSTLSYLLGRVFSDRGRRFSAKVKEEYMGKMDALISIKSSKSDKPFFNAVAERSLKLSRIKAENDVGKMTEYIHLLIGDDFAKMVNRNFYLQFYGDRMDDYGEILEDEPLFNGFDIFRTYHILTKRLIKIDSTSARNVMLPLELFTLCDLIQVRIDRKDAIDKKSKAEVPSFFYNEKYSNMAKDVINKVLSIIRSYLEQLRASGDKQFISYLELCRFYFAQVKKKLEKGPLTTDSVFCPSQVLQKTIGLAQVKRVGWNIPNTPAPKSIDKSGREAYQSFNDVYETTLEHTFESYAIGLLFLPEKPISCQNGDYDKQTILNILLIHDIGEIKVGDLIPGFKDIANLRRDEDRYCKELFLQSIHKDISNLNKQFDMWTKWENYQDTNQTDDYNIMVAKDIDIIQRLYKLLVLLSAPAGLSFSKGRISEFWGSKDSIITNEGKKIFSILIYDDPLLRSVRESNKLV